MDLLAFVLAVLVVTATPGPAFALIVRRAGMQGFRPAVATVLGLEAGLFAWAVMAGLGLAAVVAASEVAYWVLRVVGAAVLVYLGVRALLAAQRSSDAPDTVVRAYRPWRAFGEGLLVQLANPKAAVFVLALYTQFVPADARVMRTVLLLATLQVAIETVLYLALAAAVGSAGAWFRRSRVRRALDGVCGSVLVALGLRLALAPR
ncbi:MAG: LysE family translocator [Actinomycetes bacterium]